MKTHRPRSKKSAETGFVHVCRIGPFRTFVRSADVIVGNVLHRARVTGVVCRVSSHHVFPLFLGHFEDSDVEWFCQRDLVQILASVSAQFVLFSGRTSHQKSSRINSSYHKLVRLEFWGIEPAWRLSEQLLNLLSQVATTPRGIGAATSALAMAWATLKDVATCECIEVESLFESEVAFFEGALVEE